MINCELGIFTGRYCINKSEIINTKKYVCVCVCEDKGKKIGGGWWGEHGENRMAAPSVIHKEARSSTCGHTHTDTDTHA